MPTPWTTSPTEPPSARMEAFDDPNDARWRLIRPTIHEPLWIAVRPLPRHSNHPVTLQKLRYGSTRTLVTFDADHLTPDFLQAFADRAHLTWHPQRIDHPDVLPAAWLPAIQQLLHSQSPDPVRIH